MASLFNEVYNLLESGAIFMCFYCHFSKSGGKTLYFDRKVDLTMTEQEKKLLQAKHRLEEAEARNRVRERKARTRRLIQEGAVLEKVFPQIVTVELEKLEEFLHSRMRTDF